MNLLGIFLIIAVSLFLAVKAHAATGQGFDGIAITAVRVLASLLGSSLAVVFHFGEQRAMQIKRFFIGVAFASSSAGVVMGHFQKQYEWAGTLDEWWFVSFILGMLGYIIVQTVYSQSVLDLIDRVLAWKR